MRNLILWILLVSVSSVSANESIWAKTGHRVVGEVADTYLKPSAKRAISKLLQGQSLAEVSTFADEIKSDSLYDRFYTWHYVNFPFDGAYGDSPPNPEGDIITGIAECKRIIQAADSSEQEKAFYLKMLVHLIGDLHQPLHIGKAEDRGGNDFRVRWFFDETNLHSVWDAKLIDYYGMSYTELAANLPRINRKARKQLALGTTMDWVQESRAIAKEVYASTIPEENLRYRYHYIWWPTVEQQLLKGGIRLARVLNELF